LCRKTHSRNCVAVASCSEPEVSHPAMEQQMKLSAVGCDAKTCEAANFLYIPHDK
jgi:hypothetical protein